MKNSGLVRLIGSSLIVLSMSRGTVAQSSDLQRGISVEMAATTNAASVPAADNADAWIVTVTSDSHVYFGIDRVAPQGLLEAMKNRPRSRGQEFYVKADDRAPFSSVAQVLEIAHTDQFDRAVLLTAQPSGAEPGARVPPKGLAVWLGAASYADAVVVQIDDDQGLPKLKVGDEDVPLQSLEGKLKQLLQSQRRIVLLKAGGQVPFRHIAHVIDACGMAGAKPVLAEPEL